MKKVIAWLLVLSLTAAISIGATLAYLTDTDEDVNVMTLGKVKIDQLEYERVDDESKDADATVQEFHDNKPLLPAVTDKDFDYTPGDTYVDWEQIGKEEYTSPIWDPSKINNEVDKMVFIKNKGDYDAFVRTVFAFEAGNYKTLDQFKSMMHLNLNETDYTWEWVENPVTIGESTYFVATATYNKVLAPGGLTEISLSQIALDKTATNEDVEAFGDTYQILVKSQGIQADGFDNAAIALDEGFGEIDDKNVPWETDAPTKGGTVFNALRYLNADVTAEDLTTKVSTVTFGLNKDHADIIAKNKGTLVDVEQDVPVYAYYVNNGGLYDVYLLSDDDIYLPKDSTGLMKDMTELTAVYTDNLNTSRTEIMRQLFRKCAKLTTVDTTNWDTSKVTDMHQVFYQCKALQSIPGIEDWETALSTTMRGMFRECGIKGDLDLSGWDVSKVTEMYQMFYMAPNLVTLNTDGWKMGNCTTMAQMFYKATSLTGLDAEGWDTGAVTDMSYFMTNNGNVEYVNASGWNTSKVTNMYAMFFECLKLKSLNVTGWDTSNVTDVTCMFTRCRGLTEMIGSGGLNFSKVTNFGSMCEGWDSMPYIDVTNWNCGSGTNFDQMFAWALKLEKLEGLKNWDVSNATSMARMFYASVGLKEIDVTGWDVSNVKAINGFICSQNQNAGDMQLEKAIGFNTWNLANVEKNGSMFYGCGKLEEVDLSGWVMPKLTTMTHMFADCHNLQFVDFSGWQTPALTCMDAIFNHCKTMKTADLSDIDTANVREFSQMFEHCYALESIQGLENFDTRNGQDFSEMFSNCYALKELNLSTFDTRNANAQYLSSGAYENWVFLRFMEYCTGLEKVTFGPYFSFDGDGSAPNGYKFVMPAASNVEGWDGKWYTADGTGYLPSEIPEMTAATYYAVNPLKPATPPVDSTNP